MLLLTAATSCSIESPHRGAKSASIAARAFADHNRA
jgi:hypothetical protein